MTTGVETIQHQLSRGKNILLTFCVPTLQRRLRSVIELGKNGTECKKRYPDAILFVMRFKGDLLVNPTHCMQYLLYKVWPMSVIRRPCWHSDQTHLDPSIPSTTRSRQLQSVLSIPPCSVLHRVQRSQDWVEIQAVANLRHRICSR